MDPPRHRQLRSLITQAFSARTIAQMAPQIERIVDELIDRVQARGEMDWMSDMANPLPVMVISDMLGLPREEWRQFKAWTDALMSFNPAMVQAQQHFIPYFVEAIEERRKAPGNDILSLLITAEVDGERLSFPDLMSFCFTLFIAGNITTTNSLGNAILCFDQHPEELERLRQHPELIPSAVEEVLRAMPPGRVGPNGILDGRTATTDVQLGDQLIREGDRVLTVSLSNNYDESQFSDPERFDIGRQPNHHLSFGYGIHFCIGAPLARLEMKVALSKMLQRLPELHLLHDEPLHVVDSRIMFGPKRLPVAFQAA
jgi:cytochrome P450